MDNSSINYTTIHCYLFIETHSRKLYYIGNFSENIRLNNYTIRIENYLILNETPNYNIF